jgi:hypothetical protein
MELIPGRHTGLPLQVRLKGHFFSKNGFVLLLKHADRNPSGITCGYATLDLLLHALAKGVLLFKKRSTPFHKEVLPTFTKQLRKNYTIITLLLRALQI